MIQKKHLVLPSSPGKKRFAAVDSPCSSFLFLSPWMSSALCLQDVFWQPQAWKLHLGRKSESRKHRIAAQLIAGNTTRCYKTLSRTARAGSTVLSTQEPVSLPAPLATKIHLLMRHEPRYKHTKLSETREHHRCKPGQEHGPTKNQLSMV